MLSHEALMLYCYLTCQLKINSIISFLFLVGSMLHITKTSLYNVDPLKPQFYIVRLRITGVYIIFLFLLKNIDCGYLLEPPRQAEI